MNSKLKGCPAYTQDQGHDEDGQRIDVRINPIGPTTFRVVCSCGCSGPERYAKEEAIAAWNALPRVEDAKALRKILKSARKLRIAEKDYYNENVSMVTPEDLTHLQRVLDANIAKFEIKEIDNERS